MTQKTQKNRILWITPVLLAVLFLLLSVLALRLPGKLAGEPQLSAQQTTQPPQTEATTQATEPTLPPPAANPYAFTDFQYDGRYRVCLAAPTMAGIDVSYHQKDIDWQAVAESGIEFVMIRVGYRGYETGLLNPDEKAQENYQGAKAAGLQVGAYIFSQAVTVEEALEEAEFLLEQVKDWEVELPLVFDWEQKKEGRTLGLDSRIVTDCAVAFCHRIREAGYETMVYFNPHHAKRFFHLEELVDFPFWLAYYTDRMQYAYQVKMWQYTNTGSVPGIETDVDINIWFLE